MTTSIDLDFTKEEASSEDLQKVKEISQMLKLSTRRPSVIQWKQSLRDKSSINGNMFASVLKSRKFQLESVNEQGSTTNKKSDNEKGKTTLEENIRKNKSIPNQQKSLLKLTSNHKIMTAEDIEEEKFTMQEISFNLQDLQNKLMQMRVQDNSLAHQLLEVRRKMNLMKMEEEHACMIDDVTWELEEEEEETNAMTRLYKACDLSEKPPAFLLTQFTPLKNMGVSKMNLNDRRFSIR